MNQYNSNKAQVLTRLAWSRQFLARAAEYRRKGADGQAREALRGARVWLGQARTIIAAAPASTRRRWACGK